MKVLVDVAERVRHGGHNIPESDIRRRYQRSLVNLFQLYLPLVDRWAIFDNTGAAPRAIATHNNQETEILDEVWYLQMKNRAEEYANAPNQ